MNPAPKYLVILVFLALAAAGCGSSGKDGDPANTGGSGPQDSGAQGPGGQAEGPAGGPGGSGKVAAVSGSTAQVQNQSGQVAVTWNAKTTFTQEVPTTAAALRVGDCVVALPAMSSSSAPPEVGSEDESDGPVTAATVRVTAPVDGSCGSGMRREQGPGPDDAPEDAAPEDGAPEDGAPEDGAPKDGIRRIAGPGAIGKVTAVTGSGFTVESALPDPESDSESDSDSTTSTEVTTTADTTWTTTKRASAKAVAVGRCVTSMGRADATGAITAESITVSSPVDGECAAGFGAPRMMERTS